MSKEARERALVAISNRLTRCTDADKDRPFLAAAPLMAIVEAVQVLDEAGLLVDPNADVRDPDEPIPYTVSAPPGADDCPGRGCCHGLQKWCDSCGNVARVCDQHGCDAHGCPGCDAGKDEPHSAGCEALQPSEEPGQPPCGACAGRIWRYNDDSLVERCDHCAVYPTDEAAKEAKAAAERTVVAEIRAARVPCPACGEGLTRDGECLNFPSCKNANIPF